MNQSPVQEVTISLQADSRAHHATIPRALWDLLALERTGTLLLQSANRPVSSLVCSAVPSDDVESVLVPKVWAQTYPLLALNLAASKRSLIQHQIRSIMPVPLVEVVLAALSQSAYQAARRDTTQLENFLGTNIKIVRHGDIVTQPPPLGIANGNASRTLHNLEYQILMLQPVLQGIFVRDQTKLILVPPQDPEPPSPQPGSTYESSDGELSDIDESFLLNSILAPRSGIRQPSGDSSDEGVTAPTPSHGANLFTLRYEANLLSSDDSRTGDELEVYLKTPDLAKIPAFSGDWVTVSLPDCPSAARLVKAYGSDSLGVLPSMSVVASPAMRLLLYSDQATPLSNTPIVSLQSCPFGARDPPIPTAKFVSVARIATPITTQKKYQPLCLRALRNYFNDRKRIVKKGDVLVVPLDVANASLLEDVLESGDSKEPADELVDIAEMTSITASSVACFRIVNVEYDLVHTDASAAEPDSHFAAVMGELGCWTDVKSTRLLQSGIENALVPNVDALLESPTRLPLRPILGPNSVFRRPASAFQKLRDIFGPLLHPSASRYDLPTTVLLQGAPGSGKSTMVTFAAQSYGLHILEVNCYDLADETEVKTEGALRAKFDQAAHCAPSVLLLRNIDALARADQKLETGKDPLVVGIIEDCIVQLKTSWRQTGYPTILICTVADAEKIPLSVLSTLKHEIRIEAPDELERLEILQNLFSKSALAPDVSLDSIATQTAALVAADLVDLSMRVRDAGAARILNVSRTCNIPQSDILAAGYQLNSADFDIALGAARVAFSTSIGAPSIPKVTWDDVGGLASVKADILDTVQLPLQHPELFSQGMKQRSGILLYGPPGTGKTLLAKAVATSCALNFFSVKGPELLNMYIGESEANVRRVFQRARDARPCVIFFDELDSVAPKRGNHGDSGGVMDRIVSQLLAELDGMSDGKASDVFVIGATNRPDLLDPALLRPGRFDKLLYLGVSDSHEAQLKILEALTRKFRLDPNMDLKDVADKCPFNYTGADLYALCSDAMLKAMTRKASEVDQAIATLNSEAPLPGHPYPLTPQYYLAKMAKDSDTDVIVGEPDFDAALKELEPSVSDQEMEHYRKIQQRFAKGVDKKGSALNDRLDVQGSSLLEQEQDGEDVRKHTLNGTTSLTARDKGKGRAKDV